MLSAQSADNCWKLQCKSSLAGEMTSIFNADSIRIDFANLSLSVVAKAPKWEGRLFSEQTNNYMVISVFSVEGPFESQLDASQA